MNLGSGCDEVLLRVAAQICRDDHDGVLAECLRHTTREASGATEDLRAVSVDRALVDLDHEAVLSTSLPDATRSKVSRVRKGPADEPLDATGEASTVEGDGDVLVSSSLEPRWDSRTDVKANCARRGKVASSSSSHDDSLTGPHELEKRAGRRNGRFWLYFEYDEDENLKVETSWLPDLPDVKRVLRPLGFVREKSGAYWLVLTKREAVVHLSVLRVAVKALAVLLEEGFV